MVNKKIDKIKVAAGQFDIKIFDKEYNIKKMEELTRKAFKKNKIDLIVFPEAATAGYCFKDKEETLKSALTIDGEEVKHLCKLSDELNVNIAFGTVELEAGNLYNAAFMIEPKGIIHKYHKTHLPFMGLDKHVKKGDELKVFDTRFGKVGIIICYELRFPEPSRVLSLQRARLIIQPTNLPLGGESHMEYFGKSRACENRVHLISCNRCGHERGFQFFGRSQIIDYTGKVLSEALDVEEIIYGEFDLTLSEKKNIIVIPEDYETHIYEDRNPQIYKVITAKTDKDGFVK